MTARHPWLARTVLLDGDPYTLDRVDGPYAHLSTPTTLRAVDLRTTTLSLAPTEAPPAAPTAPALPTEPGPLSATLLARLGVADRAELPARELAALHLGHPPTDAEIRAVLAETGTTKQAPAATLDTPGGPLTIARIYRGNRVWLDITRKK